MAKQTVIDPSNLTDEQLAEINSTNDVLGYTDLQKRIAEMTGKPVAHVKDILNATQRVIAAYVREETGNRVHFGRLGVFLSRQTKTRKVNNPRQPGTQTTSVGHKKITFQPGSHTKAFVKGERQNWDDK